MHRYSVYGLTVASDGPFPELSDLTKPARTAPVDIEVSLRRRRKTRHDPSEFIQRTMLPDGTPWLNCARIEQGYLLRYVGFADFVIDQTGSRIVCWSAEDGVSPTTIRHLVLDQVFPMVLNLRGREAIHATAIVTPKGACAFTGPAGSGKSTLAASFLLAGYQTMGDDCLALVNDDDAIRAIPAYPGMRLWTDAAVALKIDGGSSQPVAHYTRKRRMLAEAEGNHFPTTPQRLARIYRVIRPGDDEPQIDAPVIEELAPAEAFIELVSSTFPLDVTDREMLARHFRFIQTVSTAVPLKRLRIPNDHSALPAVRAVILADLDRM